MKLQKQVALIAMCMVLVPESGFGADLSPGKWKAEEKARAEQAEQMPWPLQARVVEGQQGLVTGTMSPIAVHAGMEALRQGGTAADAAATVALTQVTTALGSYVSYAGIMELVYYDAKSGKVTTMDAGWDSYLGETDPKSIPVTDLGALNFGRTPTEGAEGRKTLVPGFMAGIEQMHKRHGRLKWSKLFAPAIWYAENGVTISPTLGAFFMMQQKYLARTAEGKAFMHQAGGDLPKVGDKFVQADLAKTLRAVATEGAGYMYTGAWGQHFVEAVEKAGGKATMGDMKRYEPTWEEPLSTTFMGQTIYVPGKSNENSYQVLEALNLAEAMKLDEMGPYNKDAKAFRALTGLLRKAEADGYTDQYMRQHGMKSLREEQITKAYAKTAAASLEVKEPPPQKETSHHSDAVVVVDRWGNIAALTHTINTVLWGTTGMVVDGVPIPDAAGFQQDRLAGIKPGDRVPNDMTPVIVMEGTKPVLAMASIGASLMPETVRLLVGTLANKLDPMAAMAAPVLLMPSGPMKAGDTFMTRPEMIPMRAYDAEFLARLKELDVAVEQRPAQDVSAFKGTVVMGTMDAKSGAMRAVETPGVYGFAEAY
jgi:gamma-glutamyltranspeptidase/glutathione hydrolase